MSGQLIDKPAKKTGIALRAATRDGIRLAHAAIAAREQRLKDLVGIDTKQKEKR